MKSFSFSLLVNGTLACIPFHTWCREPLSAGISVSVCGRSEQCFRSYPRNYTSVWLSAPTPNPQDVGTRYQTLIACHVPLPPAPLFFIPSSFSSCLACFTSFHLPFSIPQDNGTTPLYPRPSRAAASLERRGPRFEGFRTSGIRSRVPSFGNARKVFSVRMLP